MVDAAAEWRAVPGTGGRVEVNRYGALRRVSPTGTRTMVPRGHPRGYPSVDVRFDDVGKVTLGVQAAVLLAFVGPRPTLSHRASFLDGDPQHVDLSNLAWLTPLENHDLAQDRGAVPGRGAREFRGVLCYRCTRCGVWQPPRRFRRLTPTYSVHGRENSRCGLTSECVSCETDRKRERRQEAKLNGGRTPSPTERILPLLSMLDGIQATDPSLDAVPLPGARIAAARARRGISRAVLAVRAGIHPETMDQVERCLNVPRPKTMARLVAALTGEIPGQPAPAAGPPGR